METKRRQEGKSDSKKKQVKDQKRGNLETIAKTNVTQNANRLIMEENFNIKYQKLRQIHLPTFHQLLF